MKTIDRIVEVVGITAGIIILITMLSSCGTSNLTNEQVKHRNKVDYEINKLYLEYSYKRDSLIIEFYKK